MIKASSSTHELFQSPWSQAHTRTHAHTHTPTHPHTRLASCIFKGKSEPKKRRYLTFHLDSSLKVQILFSWGQGEVNVPPHSPPRPLTYLASLQTPTPPPLPPANHQSNFSPPLVAPQRIKLCVMALDVSVGFVSVSRPN